MQLSFSEGQRQSKGVHKNMVILRMTYRIFLPTHTWHIIRVYQALLVSGTNLPEQKQQQDSISVSEGSNLRETG